jgi:hypothetical protein
MVRKKTRKATTAMFLAISKPGNMRMILGIAIYVPVPYFVVGVIVNAVVDFPE